MNIPSTSSSPFVPDVFVQVVRCGSVCIPVYDCGFVADILKMVGWNLWKGLICFELEVVFVRKREREPLEVELDLLLEPPFDHEAGFTENLLVVEILIGCHFDRWR